MKEIEASIWVREREAFGGHVMVDGGRIGSGRPAVRR